MKASKKREDDFEKRMAKMKKWMNSKKGQAALDDAMRISDESSRQFDESCRVSMEDLLRPFDI